MRAIIFLAGLLTMTTIKPIQKMEKTFSSNSTTTCSWPYIPEKTLPGTPIPQLEPGCALVHPDPLVHPLLYPPLRNVQLLLHCQMGIVEYDRILRLAQRADLPV